MADSNDIAELVPNPGKSLLYFSPMILARRRRLLKETRHMIAEKGLSGFSVRKLCQRAGVAQRTLYNAFQSKDRLIAFAIREAFEEFQAYIRSNNGDSRSLAGMLSGTIAVNRRNFRVRNYTKAVCALYFSPTTPRDVWETLQNMSMVANTAWLRRRKNDLHAWVDIDHLAHLLANTQYATINDWCLGRLEDHEYLPRLAENMLMVIVAAARGELALEAMEYIESIRKTGDVTSFATVISDPPIRKAAAGSEAEADC